jgi:hypothetical protein
MHEDLSRCRRRTLGGVTWIVTLGYGPASSQRRGSPCQQMDLLSFPDTLPPASSEEILRLACAVIECYSSLKLYDAR